MKNAIRELSYLISLINREAGGHPVIISADCQEQFRLMDEYAIEDDITSTKRMIRLKKDNKDKMELYVEEIPL